MNANFNPDGNLNVNSNLNPRNAGPDLGGRSEIVSCNSRRYFKKLEYLLVLLIFSILQPSGQSLGGSAQVLSIVCCLMLLCRLPNE